jgi:hypothetical protein
MGISRESVALLPQIEDVEAFISPQGEKGLQISSELARATARKPRRQGAEMRGLRRDSEQAPKAVGDHWTLLGASGRKLVNEVGEVARFERTDYSFQVHPSVSRQLEERNNQCYLLFIKYFPFLRDTQRKPNSNSWLYDQVACLVLLEKEKHFCKWNMSELDSSLCVVRTG